MDKERYQHIRRIFLTVRDLPASGRSAYLVQACGEDNALRAEVEKFLADEEKASRDSDFLKQSPVGRVLPSTQDQAAALPGQVGRYHILGVLGHGGMGIVYEAEQDKPKRRVALKVIRPDLLSPEAQKRFELEVELLGRLQHPGIAAIHDAGTVETPLGRQPYFAMELIEGEPLIDYAARHQPDMQAKLNLFLKICQAVQHAHQHGIIHRDLKPGNILVDAHGNPKILDFGVAKATDVDIQGTAVETNAGGILGTFQYMSPEQAAGESKSVDTRSDVYALGVVLYELLTGGLPYNVSKRALLEAARVVCETPPARPSTIARAIRGDIETILLKTLEKNRERRYRSVGDLSDDISRFMEDRPIEARPPSALYQLKKLAWRRKGLVGGISATLAAIVIGGISTLWYAVEANAQRDNAKDQRDIARAERASALESLGLLEEALAGTMPFGKGNEPTVKQLLENTEKAIPGKLGNMPVAAARIHTVLGEVYYRWRELEPSERHHRKALALRLEHLGKEHADTLATLNNLAVTLKTMDRFEEAEKLQTQSLKGRTRLFGKDDFRTVTSLNNLASVLLSQGRLDEADSLFQETIERLDRTLGPADEHALTARIWRGFVLTKLGRVDQAEAVQRAAVETMRFHPPGDPKFQHAALDALVHTLKRQNKWTETATLQRELLNLMAKPGGKSHPRYSRVACQLAISLQKLGEIDEAEKTFEDLLSMQLSIIEKAMLPAKTIRESVNDWAYCLSSHRDGEVAVKQLRAFAQRVRDELGATHWFTMIADYYLAVTIVKAGGSTEEAEGILQGIARLVEQHKDDANYQVLGDRVQKCLEGL